VGLRLALAHGSILTLANYNQTEKIRLQSIKLKFWVLIEERKSKTEFLIVLTVGMAVATVATTAAFAPAITPSKTYQQEKITYQRFITTLTNQFY
jgi:hypothetical protein